MFNNYFPIAFLLLTSLLHSCSARENPAELIRSCSTNFGHVFNRSDFDHILQCLSDNVLNDVFRAIARGLKIPSTCFNPSPTQLAHCVRQVVTNFVENSFQLDSSLLGSVTGVVSNSRMCVQEVTDLYQRIVKFVTSGCQINSTVATK